ncbi:MAG: HAD family hydrolase [Chloroflexi bacterium]|nr:HAD family hydrolase [Chloroflexota bacterium]
MNKIGVPWGIVTNGSPIQQTVVENLGMYREASAVVVSSLVELRKPDKRIFELAMSLVAGELSADKFLFVGDNPTADIVGASEAGNKTAWLSRCREWAVGNCNPDVVIESVGELAGVISA